jgi:hypothetical protein
MNQQGSDSLKKPQQKGVSRRSLIRAAAGAALGTGVLVVPKPSHAWQDEDRKRCQGPRLKPIPGGVAPFKPFGVIIHHNPLNPAAPLANINDPSQISDFDGVVGLTHIRGGGTGTESSGVPTPLAYQADMGFGKGKFIDINGHQRSGTFAFV